MSEAVDSGFEESCGNVFIDLGFPPHEAIVMTLEADLFARLHMFIEQQGWTQARVAQKFCLTPGQALDLMRGNWKPFDLRDLMLMAARLGWSINVVMDDVPEKTLPESVAKHSAQPPIKHRRRTKREAVTA